MRGRDCSCCLRDQCRPASGRLQPRRPAGGEPVEIVRYEDQSSRAHIEPARLEDKPGLAVVFEGTKDLHYYARDETAPAPG